MITKQVFGTRKNGPVNEYDVADVFSNRHQEYFGQSFCLKKADHMLKNPRM